MRGALSATLMTLVCGTCLPMAQPVLGQHTPAQASDEAAASEQSFSYVGVMGEITNPGVYEFRSGDLVLGDVLKRAGDPTPASHGSIGIIRNAQPSPQKFYASNLQAKLQPGDIVIVDRATRARHAVHQVQDAAEKKIQLAFLNLLDRPVVLEMRRNQASLARILTLLGQPPEVLPSVEVIETGAAIGLPRSGHGPNADLQIGTVLVFNLDATRYDLIPTAAVETLPLPLIEEGLATSDKTNEQDTVVAAHAEAADSLSAVATTVSQETVSEDVEFLDGPDDDDGALPVIQPRNGAVGSQPIQVASLESGSLTAHHPGFAVAPPEVVNEPHAAQAVPAPNANEIPSSQLEVVAAPTSSLRTSRVAIAVAGILGVLVSVVAFTLLWITIGRETAHRTQPLAATGPTAPLAAPPVSQTESLDALVKDELPVIEEKVGQQLPAALHSGAPSPQRIRIDGGHTETQPHAQPTELPDGAVTTRLVFQTSTDDTSDQWGGPISAGNRDSDESGIATGRSVLDRVLSSVHGAQT